MITTMIYEGGVENRAYQHYSAVIPHTERRDAQKFAITSRSRCQIIFGLFGAKYRQF